MSASFPAWQARLFEHCHGDPCRRWYRARGLCSPRLYLLFVLSKMGGLSGRKWCREWGGSLLQMGGKGQMETCDGGQVGTFPLTGYFYLHLDHPVVGVHSWILWCSGGTHSLFFPTQPRALDLVADGMAGVGGSPFVSLFSLFLTRPRLKQGRNCGKGEVKDLSVMIEYAFPPLCFSGTSFLRAAGFPIVVESLAIPT